LTEILEEIIASIFRVDEYAKHATNKEREEPGLLFYPEDGGRR
jgi:hypothetical protein